MGKNINKKIYSEEDFDSLESVGATLREKARTVFREFNAHWLKMNSGAKFTSKNDKSFIGEFTMRLKIENSEKIINNIKTINNKKMVASWKHYRRIAALYNNLFSEEVKYRISHDWECIPISHERNQVSKATSAIAKGNATGISEGAQPNRNKQVKFPFAGDWIGTHLHSRNGANCIRKIFLHIEGNERAEVRYNSTKNGEEHFTDGLVKIGIDGRQIFIQFEQTIGDEMNKYTARLLYCLTRNTNEDEKMSGTYSGFSKLNQAPICGAAFFKMDGNIKNRPKLIKNSLKNIFVEDQKDEMWDNLHINEVKHAFDNYLDLPTPSLSKQLRARFWGYKVNTELDGHFVTIGIGSGGMNGKLMDTLISYPMFFKDGICTSCEPKENRPITCPVRTVGNRDRHIWLHLRDEKKSISDQSSITISSYFIDGVNEMEFRGISCRINAADTLQGRKEILIRVGRFDKKKLEKMQLVKYKFNDNYDKTDKNYDSYASYNKLKSRYYDKYSFFKELIDHFEDLQRTSVKPNNFILQSNNQR